MLFESCAISHDHQSKRYENNCFLFTVVKLGTGRWDPAFVPADGETHVFCTDDSTIAADKHSAKMFGDKEYKPFEDKAEDTSNTLGPCEFLHCCYIHHRI